MEIYVDDEAKLTLHGLVQVYLTCVISYSLFVLVDILVFNCSAMFMWSGDCYSTTSN